MDVTNAVYTAFRDILGGAFGGLLASWAIADINQQDFTIISLTITVLYIFLVLLFDRMRPSDQKQEQSQNRHSSEQIWPPHRAS